MYELLLPCLSHMVYVKRNRGMLWSVLLWLPSICSCTAVDVNFRGEREKERVKPKYYVMCPSSKDFAFLLVLFHRPV